MSKEIIETIELLPLTLVLKYGLRRKMISKEDYNQIMSMMKGDNKYEE